jgi:GxxExxY protein
MVVEPGSLGDAAELTRKIIGCAFRVHRELGSGFLEKVYENAMVIELRKAGLAVRQQAPISVQYDGHVVGEYFADLLVEEEVVCELKAAMDIAPEHETQLVSYLSATGKNIGLLLNFGKSVAVKRKYRVHTTRFVATETDDAEYVVTSVAPESNGLPC